jgi:hypothetical protein
VFMEPETLDRPTLRTVEEIAKLCALMDEVRSRNPAALPAAPRRNQYGM